MKDTKKIDEFIVVYNDTNTYPTLEDVAHRLNIAQRTVREKASKLKKIGHRLVDRSKIVQPKTVDEQIINANLKSQRLEQKVKELEAQLSATHKEALGSRKLKELIHDINNVNLLDNPDWLISTNNKSTLTGIPVLFLSDIHFDEVVDPKQIGGYNVYNREVAVRRIQNTFNTAVDLLLNHIAKPQYEGIVVALGGDLLSGNIHEELSESNEFPVLKSLTDLSELIIQGISGLADKFGKVFVVGVVGNHSRLHKKPRAKNKVHDNYEWLIYQYIGKHFKNDERISVHVPDGADAIFKIYNTKFLLTHGDTFRGGNGIAGIFSPLMLGNHKKQKRQNVIGDSYDILLLGHFHQYIHTGSLIANGSIKGFDEYAYNSNFVPELPQQALFVVHPTMGITFRLPILCDDNHEERKTKEAITIW